MTASLADHPRALALEETAITNRVPYLRVRDWLRRPETDHPLVVPPVQIGPAAKAVANEGTQEIDGAQPWVLQHAAQSSEWASGQTTINVGENTRAELWILGQGSGVSDTAVDIHLGRDASLRIIHVAQWAPSTTAFGSLNLKLGENATVQIHDFQLEASCSYLHVDAQLDGEQAAVELQSLSLFGAKGRSVLQADMRHNAESTISQIDVRNALAGQARRSVTGTVRVGREGQQTDSAQICRSLLLSPKAGADMRPELEIYADQVKCAHGATCGELDQSALHYLRSRGLDVLTARQLLLKSFAFPLLQKLPEPAVEILEPAVNAALTQLGRSLSEQN